MACCENFKSVCLRNQCWNPKWNFLCVDKVKDFSFLRKTVLSVLPRWDWGVFPNKMPCTYIGASCSCFWSVFFKRCCQLHYIMIRELICKSWVISVAHFVKNDWGIGGVPLTSFCRVAPLCPACQKAKGMVRPHLPCLRNLLHAVSMVWQGSRLIKQLLKMEWRFLFESVGRQQDFLVSNQNWLSMDAVKICNGNFVFNSKTQEKQWLLWYNNYKNFRGVNWKKSPRIRGKWKANLRWLGFGLMQIICPEIL